MTLTSTPEDCHERRRQRRYSACVAYGAGHDRWDGLAHLHEATRGRLGSRQSLVNNVLQIALEPPVKVREHGASAAEHNALVQPSPDVDRRRLDDIVDDLGQRSQKVRRGNLRIEEDLGGEEALVPNVDGVFLRSQETDF